MPVQIQYFRDGIEEPEQDPIAVNPVVEKIIEDYSFSGAELNVIFLPDEELRTINMNFLNHDVYTDVITFDLTEEATLINGEIYVSVERIKENADFYSYSFQEELHRVIIHGVLHLAGLEDKSTLDKQTMTKQENYYLEHLKTSNNGGSI